MFRVNAIGTLAMSILTKKLLAWGDRMLRIGIICLLLLDTAAYASPTGLLDVSRDANGAIFLSSPSCQELADEIQYLRAWKSLFKEPLSPPDLPVELPEEQKCQMKINASIPQIAELLEGTKTALSGPNCWNTTLFLSGILNYRRFTSASEMSFWMQSPYCREIEPSEPPQTGDLIAIRVQSSNRTGYEEIHGMIYISDQLVFSKSTSSRMSAYGIQRANLIYQTFKLTDSSCMQVKGLAHRCNRWSNLYRCKSPSNDLDLFKRSHAEFENLFAQTENIESQLSTFARLGSGDVRERRAILEQELKVLEFQTAEFMMKLQHSHFFPNALIETIKSLKAQLGFVSKERSP